MTFDFDAFDVVIVPFPYSDRLAEKRRPALVVSGRKLHDEGFAWIAMITSAGKEVRVGDFDIGNAKTAGLPGASIVRTSKLATIEPSRILRRAGSLAKSERAAVRQALTNFLG